MLPDLARAELFLPDGWTDLLLDVDDSTAAEHYLDLARQVLPGADLAVLHDVSSGLQQWRRILQQHDVVSHGVVAVPAEGDESAANWHLVTSIVEVPAVTDLDLGHVLAHLFEKEMASAVHAESFETDLGLGFGMIATPLLEIGESARAFGVEPPAPVQVGLAVAVAAAPGAELGLLVMGMCLDAAQVVELATVVATIAGRSRLVVPPSPAAVLGE